MSAKTPAAYSLVQLIVQKIRTLFQLVTLLTLCNHDVNTSNYALQSPTLFVRKAVM